MRELTHISLFAGIAGIDIAAEWAGFETILFVEIDKYCQKVLKKHWPDVPIIGDIRDATKEGILAYTKSYRESRRQSENRQGTWLEQRSQDVAHTSGGQSGEQEARNGGQNTCGGGEEKPMENPTSVRSGSQGGNALHKGWPTSKGGGEGVPQATRWQNGSAISDNQPTDTNGRTAGNEAVSPVTLITGGFPCQPVSVAGQRRGKEDDRWLWPEMLRVIREVRPTWVVAENVAGLLRMGFNDCVSDLEGEGYETIPFLIPACAINAPHRRDRVFIVARDTQSNGSNKVKGIRERQNTDAGRICEDVADTDIPGLPDGQGGKDDARASRFGTPGLPGWWAAEPDVGRVAHGVPARVDRLRCLGNAVIPQQIYPILKAIADIEHHTFGGEK